MENVATNHEAQNDSDRYMEDLTGIIQKASESVAQRRREAELRRQPSESSTMITLDVYQREKYEFAFRRKFIAIGLSSGHFRYESGSSINGYRIPSSIMGDNEIFLFSFLQRAHKSCGLSVNEFCKVILRSHSKATGCYRRIKKNSIDNPRHKILWDVTFIIEVFLRFYFEEGRSEPSTSIFDSPGMLQNVRRHLCLVENQLPFFILKDIYELAFGRDRNYPSFIHLTCHFFKYFYNQTPLMLALLSPPINHSHSHPHGLAPALAEYRAKLEDAKHFTDLLRTLQLQQKHCSNEKSICSKPQSGWIKTKVMNIVDPIRSSLLPSPQKPVENIEAGQVHGDYLYSAVLLREAGVKFNVNTRRCLLDIDFNKKNGNFKIPPLRVDEWTLSFFLNLMAWEQSYYPQDTKICSYISLMGYLIKSAEDVDLLVQQRIIINQFGTNQQVVNLFCDLFSNTRTSGEKNPYSDLFGELNAYNAVRRHGWMAILKLQYFSTPWKALATIAAAVLLLLTLIQTICSIISIK